MVKEYRDPPLSDDPVQEFERNLSVHLKNIQKDLIVRKSLSGDVVPKIEPNGRAHPEVPSKRRQSISDLLVIHPLSVSEDS
jgi:hypothetical protein